MSAPAPVVLNAANEEAVKALLDGRIEYLDIPRIIAACLEAVPGEMIKDLAVALAVDADARRHAVRVPAVGDIDR